MSDTTDGVTADLTSLREQVFRALESRAELAEGRLAVATEALERLADGWVMFSYRDTVEFPDALSAERARRSEFAAAALAKIRPEQPETTSPRSWPSPGPPPHDPDLTE